MRAKAPHSMKGYLRTLLIDFDDELNFSGVILYFEVRDLHSFYIRIYTFFV